MPVMQPLLLSRGRRRRRREGPRLYFHLWPPVQVPSFCPASLPTRLLAMEIWPQQVACPAISAPKCPVHNLPTLSRFGKVEKNEDGGREDPDVAVSLWEDAHQPRVKVVQPASEEYSHLTFPAHHRPPHPFAPQMMAKEKCHHQRNDLTNQANGNFQGKDEIRVNGVAVETSCI